MDNRLQKIYTLMLKHGKTPNDIVDDWNNLLLITVKIFDINVDVPEYVTFVERYSTKE